MFFWNSLAFLMIQRMLAIWSLVPLPFLKPAWTSGSSWFPYCWSLAWRILSITLLACEMNHLYIHLYYTTVIYILLYSNYMSTKQTHTNRQTHKGNRVLGSQQNWKQSTESPDTPYLHRHSPPLSTFLSDIFFYSWWINTDTSLPPKVQSLH